VLGGWTISASSGRRPREARPRPDDAVPCQSSNNCVIPTSTRKTLWALTENVQKFCNEHGLERCVFGTITFPDAVVDMNEAQRRLHSFATWLRPRFPWMVMGVHRRKNRVIHYHFIAGAPVDVKTGYDFEATKNKDYRSACPWLKQEWKAWRKATNYDGRRGERVAYPEIGRFELEPIRKNGPAAARYMAGYIRDGLQYRDASDKGKRLLRYWGKPMKKRAINGQFAWSSSSPFAWLHRRKLAQTAHQLDCETMEELQDQFGTQCCWKLRDRIYSQELDYYPAVKYALADGMWWAKDLPYDAIDIERPNLCQVVTTAKQRGDPY